MKRNVADVIHGCVTVFKIDGLEVGLFAPDLPQLKRAWKRMARDNDGNLMEPFHRGEAQKVAMISGKNLVQAQEVAA